MSGVVQLILTDKEIDLLVKWGDLADGWIGTAREQELFARLQSQQRKLACDGENCKI